MDNYDPRLSGGVGPVVGIASPEDWGLLPQGGRSLVCSSSRQHRRVPDHPSAVAIANASLLWLPSQRWVESTWLLPAQWLRS